MAKPVNTDVFLVHISLHPKVIWQREMTARNVSLQARNGLLKSQSYIEYTSCLNSCLIFKLWELPEKKKTRGFEKL